MATTQKPGASPPGAPGQGGEPPPSGRHGRDPLVIECGGLETEVEELKVKYEMYFLGVERKEPTRLRSELKRRVDRLKEQFTRNTGLRFRIQTLHARFLSYERLWLRHAREKEEGTYRRDVFKARLRARGRPAPGKGRQEPAAVAEAEDVDLSDFSDLGDAPAAASTPAPAAAVPPPAARASAARPPAVPPPPAARPSAQAPAAAPRAATAAGLREAQVKAIYEAYVEAKRRCHEDVSRITPEAIARTIAKQTPEIMKQHNAREVEFKVVIKDGRAILKAVPKV